MENKSSIPALAGVVLIATFIIGACSRENSLKKDENPVDNSAFLVESGPDRIGYGDFWVIEHKKSKLKFVYVEDSNGIQLVPLK